MNSPAVPVMQASSVNWTPHRIPTFHETTCTVTFPVSAKSIRSIESNPQSMRCFYFSSSTRGRGIHSHTQRTRTCTWSEPCVQNVQRFQTSISSVLALSLFARECRRTPGATLFHLVEVLRITHRFACCPAFSELYRAPQRCVVREKSAGS